MAIKPSNEETSQCLLGVDSDTQEWYGRAPPATVNLLVAASVFRRRGSSWPLLLILILLRRVVRSP
jgi:hypothetical protein